MFDIKKYKAYARIQLKGRFKVPVIVVLITTLILTLFEIPDFIHQFNEIISLGDISIYDFYARIKINTPGTSSTALSFLRLMVDSIFTYASIKVYLKMSRSPDRVYFSTFIEGLNSFVRAVVAGLWRFFWIFLWALLFFIPGIIKAYAYSQMFFICAEYENVNITKAMRISSIITQGHKWDLFVLDLSFFGWFILGALSLGIGYFWIIPYYNMTQTNAYHAILKEALERGILKPEDLA